MQAILIAVFKALSAFFAALALLLTSPKASLNVSKSVLGAVATPAPSALTHDPVVVAAGDISCNTGLATNACKQAETAKLIESLKPDAVLALGDTQYESGAYTDFLTYYDPTWGKFKGITYPAVGNHEYGTPAASGYFQYFGVPPYYSYELGSWHLISLNTNCGKVSGCGPNSPQGKWLKADLAAHSGQCLLAYAHHPEFSSGSDPHNVGVDPLFADLYAGHVDLYLSGHDHDYERFAALNPSGQADNRGVVQIVAGTGGKNERQLGKNGELPGSQIFINHSFGVLRLVLHRQSYDWSFVSIEGSKILDSGTAPCHAQ